MQYISTRPSEERISFQEAVLNGLAMNGGLYFPTNIPRLPVSFFDTISTLSRTEIAVEVLRPFVQGSLSDEQLQDIVTETLSFPTPVVPVKENVYCLELFHGPTQAFKDVGARFLSRCLSHFETNDDRQTIVLVATSGDTGSAVAHGFYNVPNVLVKILFPKGKVSPYQEFQMTSLGKNIQALEVNGTFDDCQALVKRAFSDEDLRKKVRLSSANSINVARLLPQMLYYFFAYQQLQATLQNKGLVVSVPSGNLGNITAGLFAQKMGLPIKRFVAAHNDNDTFTKYMQLGRYTPKSSVRTVSNAMDVGAPSNFERITTLYQDDFDEVKKHISSFSYDDLATLEEIRACHQQHQYLLDPHGAVGKLGLEATLQSDEVGVFIGTAHPQKFSEVIQRVIPDYRSVEVDLSACSKVGMENDFDVFREKIFQQQGLV